MGIKDYNHEINSQRISPCPVTRKGWRVEKKELHTLNMPNTASLQLVFSSFRYLFGLRSHIKSTPQMFPRWLRWLTHWVENIWNIRIKHKHQHKRLRMLCEFNGIDLMFICISVLMGSIIWWHKALGSKELVNMPTLAAIPVTAKIWWKTWELKLIDHSPKAARNL